METKQHVNQVVRAIPKPAVAVQKKRWTPPFEVVMMLPALILLAAISIIPFLYMIWMSFNTVSLFGGVSFQWAGLANWIQMFTDPDVKSSWLISLIYFVATVGVEMILGIAIALLLYEITWGKNIALSLIIIPMFIAPVIVGLLGRFMLDPTYGLYSWLFKSTHIYTHPILGEQVSAFVSVVLMDVWEWTPLITLITLAGLVSMSQEVLEAAKVDGASYLARLRHVIFPLTTSVIVVALLIRAMDAIRYFDVIWLSTAGGPADSTKIIPLRLYDEAFRFFHLGYAAAIGLGMLAFSIIVANLFLAALKRREVAG
ncbi:MAG TPA: sugar ABC transporter permease [Ktedonobacteraceae bacterium]|nr:sugar ABC transporter permease [Ktedonobacteraceae bacterium]